MAKWNLDVYGVGRYGPGVPVPFLPDITSGASLPGGPLGVRARCVNPDEVMVAWNLPPQPVFTLLRLVRSLVGPPAWADDGDVLIDAPLGYAVNYLDDGLVSNRRYYYGVYVFDAEVQQWLRGGFADAMTPDRSFDEGDRMWRLMPPYYRDMDTKGQLQRFLELVGFELNLLRTEVQSLPDVWDMAVGNAVAVPLALKQFGIQPEPELGYGNQRQLLRNITMLFGSKGSSECIRMLLSSVTGWAANVTDGINLVADNQDAQQDGSVGNWRATAGGTLAYRAGDNSINSPNGIGTLVLTGTGAATMTAKLADVDPRVGIPVTAGLRYGASILCRGIARPVSLGIDWYDLHGNYLSSTPSGGPVTPNIANWSTSASVFGTAPAGAWWAGLTVNVTGVALGNVMYLTSVMVAQLDATTVVPAYQPARDARITAFADHVNEVRNPRLAADANWWGAVALADVTASGATLTIGTGDTPPPLDAAVYGQFVATAAGQGVWTLCPGLITGALYSGSIWVKVTAGAGKVRLVLRDTGNVEGYANAGLELGVNGDVVAAESPTSWHEDETGPYYDPDAGGTPYYIATDTSNATVMLDYDPIDAAATSAAAGLGDGWVELTDGLVTTSDPAPVQFSLVADGACTVRFGAGMLVRGGSDIPYFDGTIATPTADYMWEGPADGSRSHFYHQRTTRSYRFRKLLPRFLPTGRTATLLFAQSVGTGGGALYPGALTFPGYDVYPGGFSNTASFPGATTFPSYDEFPQE